MIATYELTEEQVIMLYLNFGIKPKGTNIVPDYNGVTTNNNTHIKYKIEPCNLSDNSCRLY